MKHGKTLFLLFLVSILQLGCEYNPGWDGTKAKDPATELGKATCKCVYEVMAEMEDIFDVDVILEKYDEYIKYRDHGPDQSTAIRREKFPDYENALAMEEAISIKVDECECMKPVNDDAFNKGIELNDLLYVVDKHCKLAEFYN